MWRPPPKLTVSQWAAKHARLAPEYSNSPGAWSNDRFPYQSGMMDAVNEDGVWRIVYMTSSAIGKTSAIDNIEGYFIHQDPCPMLGVLPTIDEAKGYSKERLTPFIQATPALRRVVSELRSRDAEETLRFKKYPGGYVYLAGANSAASLQRRHVRLVWADEIDSYAGTIDDEGDPISLAVQRTARFETSRLIVLAGTPKVRGISRLEKLYEESDRRRFFVPCRRCQASFVLIWDRPPWKESGQPIPVAKVVWRDNNPDTAAIRCETCGELHGDGERLEAVRRGTWRATAPFSGTAGFHIWEAYATQRLSEMVTEFLEKKKHRETLQTFVNKRLGELWEHEEGESPIWLEIKKRADEADEYRLGDVLPAGVLLIYAGIDTQNDRLAPLVYGFGRGEEAWLLYRGEIYGDPIFPETWDQLDALLSKKWRHPAGPILSISGAAIDSGGGRTQCVYNFVRRRGPRVIAIKGMSSPGLPIIAGKPTPQDVAYGGQLVKGGVSLWPVGSDTAKAEIYARLKIESGPRSIHFPAGMPDEFYEQLTAETVITRYKKGVPFQEWHLPSGKRNEDLDGTVYAFVAAIRGGIQRVNWDDIERMILAKPGDQQSSTSAPPAPGRADERLPASLRSDWMRRGPR